MPESPPTTPEAPAASSRRLIAAPRVFVPAAVLLLVFVTLAALKPKKLGELITSANTSVVTDLGWWYILVVTGFVAFAIWIAASPMGRIRLGKDGEEPEFGLKSWFAMLFAAGMGIGLVFWGVAEPLNHFAAPPPGFGGDEATRARVAMDTTYLHWGLHAWAIYVVVGLAVAYAVHRKGRPVSIRWALEPLLGKRVTGFWGDVIDVIAIVGTLFGVATSLGFGVTQVGAGLSYLGVVEKPTNTLLVVLIAVITSIALVSVVTGVDKGIKWLSNVNMGLAGVLLAAVLLLGPTVFLLSDFVQQVGSYLQNFLRLSFNTFSFRGQEGEAWLSGWTTYYWGWWMSWAPFVGVFIARISRGRTVREFVLGVLGVPTLVTFLWFAIIGGSGLHREIFGNGGLIGEDGSVPLDTALFAMLDGLPAGGVLSGLAIFLIIVFFVTSSDSGSFVVDMIATGGDPNPPIWSRAFWGGLEGVIAAVLLVAGGLAALQTMAILVALPFSIVMVLMVWSTAKALMGEQRAIKRRREHAFAERIVDHVNGDAELNVNGDGTRADTATVGTR
ncbi:MAG TPA: BCCT family transporter [Nocardioidaceae bacterium]|nr:BCCT family transporter [Nocardioidaceae bacterium]